MVVYSAHINKQDYAAQYPYTAFSPYSLCMDFILERVMMDIGKDKQCIIILEARNPTDDRILHDHIMNLIEHGNRYFDSYHFSKIKGVYFNPKWSKKSNCQKSYWSLEIADICSYPLYKYFVYGTRDPAYEIVESKLKDYPNYMGRGLKSFPKNKEMVH